MTTERKMAIAAVVGMVLGYALGWSMATPDVTVTVEPAAVQAPGPDWLQPADQQAIAIPSGYLRK